jgi:hypothetical protein
MAPLDQYLMADRNAEVAMARTAAPSAISDQAEVLVLGPHGYETAVKGTNGFVCVVLRSWTAGFDDPEFWNPKIRGPLCATASAARSYLPLLLERTKWVLAGKPQAQLPDAVKTALDRRELPTLDTVVVTYMMSKQGYLGDQNGHWHPHLMLFAPQTDASTWGANLGGSPIIGVGDPADRVTTFLIPVRKWSDGTADTDH